MFSAQNRNFLCILSVCFFHFWMFAWIKDFFWSNCHFNEQKIAFMGLKIHKSENVLQSESFLKTSQCKHPRISMSVHSTCLGRCRLNASPNTQQWRSTCLLVLHHQNVDLLYITTNSVDAFYTHSKLYTHTSTEPPTVLHPFLTGTVY